jgi:hypothetical protein
MVAAFKLESLAGIVGIRNHHLSRYHLRLRGLGTMAITRTHFAYRIDLWTDDEKEVVEHLADGDDLTVALATYHAAIERWPDKAITLRQGRHVIEDSRRSRLATLFSFPWSDKPPPERAG